MNLGSKPIVLGVPLDLALKLVGHFAAVSSRPQAAAMADEIAKSIDPGHPDTLVDHAGTPVIELSIPCRDVLVQGVDSARRHGNRMLARQLECLIRLIDPDPTHIIATVSLAGPIHDQLERVAKLTGV